MSKLPIVKLPPRGLASHFETYTLEFSMRHLSYFGSATALLSIVTIVLFTSIGCDAPAVSKSNFHGATASVVAVPKQNQQLPTDSPQQQEAAASASELLNQAGKLLSDAQEATGQEASSTGQWLHGAFGGVTDTTGSAVDGSLNWANETFKSLKDQGLTTATSTGQWLSEDWQNMESWQYKVLATNSVPVEDLENKLNELGKLGWECFSVDDQRMIFKKASESYLKRLPFKDVLRLAPLLNQNK